MARSLPLLAASLAALLATPGLAGSGGSRPDDHAPIGVMGDHLHHAGEWMLSYRYARMRMSGNRDDTRRVSVGAVRTEYGFPVVPPDMDMEIHVPGVMWAPSDAVTLMAMLPFIRLEMRHSTPTGSFTTHSNGIGDAKVSGLIRLYDGEHHRIHLNAGLSLPTGSVSRKDDTPMGRQRLPYPMQLGSGTWDLLPGLTYSGSRDGLSWGGQLRSTLRTGKNDEGYRLGNVWGLTAWIARPWLEAFSTSLRLDWQQWYDIHGDDDALMPGLVPTADPDRRAGRRLEALLGVNLLGTGGAARGHRLALEVGYPLYQNLDGPQLESDWRFSVGWQRAF